MALSAIEYYRATRTIKKFCTNKCISCKYISKCQELVALGKKIATAEDEKSDYLKQYENVLVHKTVDLAEKIRGEKK